MDSDRKGTLENRSTPGGSRTRREFLQGSAAAGVGLGLLPLSALAGDEAPRIRRRVRLGNTGLEISDIGFGGSRLRGEGAVVGHALDRGVTYFDTAESYTGGQSETVLGEALAGRRDAVVVVSKTKCGVSTSAEQLMERLEDSLRRLRTDRIDIYLNHAVNDPARLRNDDWYTFVERARQQGKLRFQGMSGHGGRLVECLDVVANERPADVVLVGYNFGQDPAFFDRLTRSFDFVAPQPELPRVLASLREKGVGVVAMKTLRGGRANDLAPYESGGATFAQAALRWVLAGKLADALIITMKTPEQVDEYLGASGYGAPAHADLGLLERYEAMNGRLECRYGCSECADACPAGVPIAEALRTRMYADDYLDLDLAREDYARLGAGASPCVTCTSHACANACPHGLPIADLVGGLHRRLA